MSATMSSYKANQIISSRSINASLEAVYGAFSNPVQLKEWWVPKGFTNTIHEFDLQPGGKWLLTMHGPEKGNYENSSIFKTVEPLKLIVWQRISQPLFQMEVGFEKLGETKTTIIFRMIFESEAECNKIKRFATPSNEENFDRLEQLLRTLEV